MQNLTNPEIREIVRENYGKVAQSSVPGCGGSVTDSSCCSGSNQASVESISKALGYSEEEVTGVPEGANMGLGCGNPQAIASLQAGETVLDLGSGGGFDSFLAAKAVGTTGRVIGIDMTPEMINKARKNAKQTGLSQVEFRLGEIEHLPVADHSVDVIISNCVINLSPEKERVFQEAFRVLRPGGRLAISDMVATEELPQEMQEDPVLYTGCVGGASSIAKLESILTQVGFVEVKIESKGNTASQVFSANIEGVKPHTR